MSAPPRPWLLPYHSHQQKRQTPTRGTRKLTSFPRTMQNIRAGIVRYWRPQIISPTIRLAIINTLDSNIIYVVLFVRACIIPGHLDRLVGGGFSAGYDCVGDVDVGRSDGCRGVFLTEVGGCEFGIGFVAVC